MENSGKMITIDQMERLRLYYHLSHLTQSAEKELLRVQVAAATSRSFLESMARRGFSDSNSEIYREAVIKLNDYENYEWICKNAYSTYYDLRTINAKAILLAFEILDTGNDGEHQVVMAMLEEYFKLPAYHDQIQMRDIKTRKEVIIRIR